MNLERLSLTYSPILLTQFSQFRNSSSEAVQLTFSSFLVCGLFKFFIKLISFSYFLLLSPGQQKSTVAASCSSSSSLCAQTIAIQSFRQRHGILSIFGPNASCYLLFTLEILHPMVQESFQKFDFKAKLKAKEYSFFATFF